MALGYNEKRPDKHNYLNFERKLVQGFEKENIPGLSMMFYGSYARKTHTPGFSDIDGILIFDDNVVINKENMQRAASVYAAAQKNNNIPVQITVSDLTTMVEGIFNTFDPTYKEGMDEDGVIVYGPDYREKFRYVQPFLKQHSQIKYNLRKPRTNLFFSEHYSQKDYAMFVEKFTKSLDSITTLSRQIMMINSDYELDRNKSGIVKSLKEFYPDIDIDPLSKISYYRNNLDSLDELYKNKNEMIKLWSDSLTCAESLLKSYMDKERDKFLQAKNPNKEGSFAFIPIPKDFKIPKAGQGGRHKEHKKTRYR